MLRDTDSSCLKFIFVNDVQSKIPNRQFRDILIQIIVPSKIYDRSDSSHTHWEKFNARKKHLKKCLGYFEKEHIDNPCL